jgi:Tfp pilus assembly protein PilF
MSLLMEALKKAEEAKRQTDRPNDPSPDLSFRFDAANADRSALAEVVTQERSAAHNVFAAQQPRPGSTLWLIAGVGTLALASVGVYFWGELQMLGAPSAVRPAIAPVAIVSPPATVSPATTPSSPPVEASAPARPLREAAPPPPAEKPAPAVPPPPTRASKAPVAAPAPSVADSPRREIVDAAVELRFTRVDPQANPALERAYDALQSGRDDDARHAYEQVLRVDGKNADALLGLATLAARQGRSDAAHVYYLRALEADPNDATARAGVLGTGRHGDEAATESRLKTALAGAPGSPPLNFALGNLYARHQRWGEAQQAYFLAYTGDPGNPDVLFNLAVSLDHLHQGTLAVQYYRRALDTGAARTTSFARDEAVARLSELTERAE